MSAFDSLTKRWPLLNGNDKKFFHPVNEIPSLAGQPWKAISPYSCSVSSGGAGLKTEMFTQTFRVFLMCFLRKSRNPCEILFPSAWGYKRSHWWSNRSGSLQPMGRNGIKRRALIFFGSMWQGQNMVHESNYPSNDQGLLLLLAQIPKASDLWLMDTFVTAIGEERASFQPS